MANIQVSYTEMESAAARLSAGRDEIHQRLGALQTQIHTLVSSGFVTDQASGRFHTAYNEYTASATLVVDKLTEIQAFLTRAAQALRDLDSQIAAGIH